MGSKWMNIVMTKPIDISKFYVIAVVSNPFRYNARYDLFKQFAKQITDQGAKLLVVEQAFGNRPFELTERDNDMHLQFRTTNELWHKENMINLGINYLSQIDPDWKYVAWIDADINFQRTDILQETVQQLQHHKFVQMFSHAVDLGPDLEPIKTYTGFVWSYFKNDLQGPQGPGHGGYYSYTTKLGFWHPGYAWAATRDAIDRTGLLDIGILGAGDHHMALALIGRGDKSVPGGVHPSYRNAVMSWQKLAERYIRRNIGYVPGMISHYWHGNKKNRKYKQRWDILTRNKYDPTKDISRDGQGLYRLVDHFDHRSIRLRDEIRTYFRQRKEDENVFLGDEE